jgi:hypothetical protein
VLSPSSITASRLRGTIGGFSLLELLVAATVFVALALILVSIASSLSSFWLLGIAHNERRSSALSAFARMARDLRFATLPPDPQATNYQFVINPANLTAKYEYPQAAFWQAPVASDRSRGNIALVGYFVQWIDEPDGPTPKLCRLLVDSNYSMQRPSDFGSDSLIASNAPATKSAGYLGQLAENVLGLWMQPLDQATNPLRNDARANAFTNGHFDSARGYITTLTDSSGKTVTRAFAPALPASLEVALIALDARTAKRLTGQATEKPSPSSGDMWADVNTFYNRLPAEIRKGAQIYSTVIDLHSAPR